MDNTRYGLGAIPSPKDIRDYVATATIQDFPDSFELPMPEVKNQGNVGACVAHALATVVEYFEMTQEHSTTKLSTAYIYGNRSNTEYKGVGMVTREALDALLKYGDVTHEEYPSNTEVPGAIELFEYFAIQLIPNGVKRRISSYYRLNDVAAMKAALLQHRPIVFTIDWYEDARVNVDGLLTSKRKASLGGHCMVMYGWNEKGWLFQNSHGTTFGNGGRAILPYDYPINEAWGVTDEISERHNSIRTRKLEESVNDLMAKNEVLQDHVDLLELKLDELLELNDELQQDASASDGQLSELQKEYNGLLEIFDTKMQELITTQEIINQQAKEIDELNGLLIKKPNTFVKFISAFVNWVLNLGKKKTI